MAGETSRNAAEVEVQAWQERMHRVGLTLSLKFLFFLTWLTTLLLSSLGIATALEI